MSHQTIANNVSQADIDQLSVMLNERDWEKISTVSQLRRHVKSYHLLRRILSSLWLAVIHLSVQKHYAVVVTTELQHAKEVGQRGAQQMVYKHSRAGRASWRVMSELDPGVLAMIDLAEPISEQALNHLLCRSELGVDAVIYRLHVQEVFGYLAEFLKEKQSALLEMFKTSIVKVAEAVIIRDHHEQPLLLDLPSVSLEMTFNKSTHICYVVPYGSAIFQRITSGDVAGTISLLNNQKASIFDVDPFGLPLLYYGAYYCMRANGIFKAIEMCNVLARLGADISHPDEVGNTPLDILADCCIAARQSDDAALVMLSSFYGKGIAEIMEEHATSHGLGDIHRVLLGLRLEYPQLEEYLQSLHSQNLAGFIDKPDFHGRSALVYAVEYGWYDAVEILVKYGANVNQLRLGDRKGLTLLHLLFAGPAQKTTLQIARVLIENGADANMRDSDGWTALHIAASWDNFIGMAVLTSAGAEVTAQTFDGENAVTLSADPDLLTKFFAIRCYLSGVDAIS